MTERYPDIRYKAIPVDPDPNEDASGPLHRVFRVLTAAILAVCLLVWAVVGAVFWLPLMLRTMVMFSVALVQSTLAGGRPTEAAWTLRDSVSFYRRGFVVAIEAVMGGNEGDAPETRPSKGMSRKRLVGEVVWAGACWYGLSLLVGLDVAGPGEAWAWVSALPWGSWWGALVTSVTGLFEERVSQVPVSG